MTKIVIGEQGRVVIQAADSIEKTLVLFDDVAIGLVSKISMIMDKDDEAPMLSMAMLKSERLEPPTDFINYMKDQGFAIRFTTIHPAFFPEVH